MKMNQEQFNLIYKQEEEYLKNLSRKHSIPGYTSEDILQELMILFYTRFNSEDINNIKRRRAWLNRTVNNLFYNLSYTAHKQGLYITNNLIDNASICDSELYVVNDEYLEERRRKQREYKKEKRKDPEYRKKLLERNKKYYQKKKCSSS